MRRMALAVGAALAVAASAATIVPPASIIGVRGPEDLESVPGSTLIVISQLYATRDNVKGDLALLDRATDRIKPLAIGFARETGWGDPGCQAPPSHIGPHGIHLSRRGDGRLQLLVVNHEERESVEYLEFDPRSRRATWRGCVRSGDGFNDVVATPEGGFVATVPTAHGRPERFDGTVAGHLVEWTPSRGLKRLRGSDAAYSNGVQISHDGRTVYFAAWTGREILRYDRVRGRISGRVSVDFMPDNLSVGPAGTFLVAGIDAMPRPGAPKIDGQLSPAFTVGQLDPRTMRVTILHHGRSGEMAGSSVALQVGQWLYLGSYTGARILKLAMPRR